MQENGEVVTSTPVGNNTSGTITTNADVTSFSPFAKASTGANNILPVSLLKWEAECDAMGVNLNWTTASEANNDYFIIEKSLDGNEFLVLTEIEGNGTTSEYNEYEYLDMNESDKMTYYRLTQVDFDGQYEQFSTITSQCSLEDVNANLNVNASSLGGYVDLNTILPGASFYKIIIIDANGKQVYDGEHFSEETNAYDRLYLGNLSKGVYFVTVTVGVEVYTQKFVW